jgi:hypothetical protein
MYPNSTKRLIIAGSLAALWGASWAACLQFTQWGRWLAFKRTWLTVVVGVGVDLAIMTIALPFRFVAMAAALISISSLGIIGRSLYNELAEDTD